MRLLLSMIVAVSAVAVPPSLRDVVPSLLSFQDAPVVDVMGATGLPDPSTSTFYMDAVDAVMHQYWPGASMNILTTPEAMAPLTGSETFNASVAQGLAILEGALNTAQSTGILGVSQSADIASILMERLDPSGTPSDLPLSFVLMGDEMNPNGGLFERFPGLQVMGITFDGATPGNDFPTVVYTHEYDGFADFPRYPLDLLSDLNAVVGIAYDHSYSAADLTDILQLPTSGATETTYYMIPSELPLSELLKSLPVVGNSLDELLTPDLTYLINLGYGNPDFGWSTTAANIPTPAELLPDLQYLLEMPGDLAHGLIQGLQDLFSAF